jgi:hypothetical protein
VVERTAVEQDDGATGPLPAVGQVSVGDRNGLERCRIRHDNQAVIFPDASLLPACDRRHGPQERDPQPGQDMLSAAWRWRTG